MLFIFCKNVHLATFGITAVNPVSSLIMVQPVIDCVLAKKTTATLLADAEQARKYTFIYYAQHLFMFRFKTRHSFF